MRCNDGVSLQSTAKPRRPRRFVGFVAAPPRRWHRTRNPPKLRVLRGFAVDLNPLFSVNQGFYVGLEGDLDLVPADFLHQPDAEDRMLEDLVLGELFPGRVLASPRQILARQQRLPAGHRRPLADRPRLPRSLARRLRRPPEIVLTLAGVAPHPRRPRSYHREDGVAQVHLAARAPRVDVAADLVLRRHEARTLDQDAPQMRTDSRHDLVVDGLRPCRELICGDLLAAV